MMFSSTVKFLLIMISNNRDLNALQVIMSEIDMNNLQTMLKKLYEERIKLKE